MEVITTHVNADFDAFGSMVVANKLYPEAVCRISRFPGKKPQGLLHGSQRFYSILSIERAKDIDLEIVKRLILVDTRQRAELGRFVSLVDSGRAEYSRL